MPENLFAVTAKEVQYEARHMLGRELSSDELKQLGARLRQYLLYDRHCGYSNTIQERIALDHEVEYHQHIERQGL